MTTQIEISDQHLESIKRVYEQILNELKQKASALYLEWYECEIIFKKLGLVSVNSSIESILPNVLGENQAQLIISLEVDNYQLAWPWVKKVSFILQKNGPMTTKGIVAILIGEYEPNLSLEATFSSISAVLSSAVKKGKLKRHKGTNREEYIYSI